MEVGGEEDNLCFDGPATALTCLDGPATALTTTCLNFGAAGGGLAAGMDGSATAFEEPGKENPGVVGCVVLLLSASSGLLLVVVDFLLPLLLAPKIFARCHD